MSHFPKGGKSPQIWVYCAHFLKVMPELQFKVCFGCKFGQHEPEEFAPFLFNTTILTRPQPVWCEVLDVVTFPEGGKSPEIQGFFRVICSLQILGLNLLL